MATRINTSAQAAQPSEGIDQTLGEMTGAWTLTADVHLNFENDAQIGQAACQQEE